MGNRGADSLINVLSPGTVLTPVANTPVTPGNTLPGIPVVDSKSIAEANSFNAKGIQSARENNLTDAIANFTNAISINPNFASAYNNRGNAKRIQKDYAGALQDLNKAIALSPNYSAAFINRGRVEMEVGKKADACADFTRAKELGNRGADQFIMQNCQ